MKKILGLLLLLVSFASYGQFVNYTNINGRYKWIAGKFDSTFTLPSGTTPSLRTGGGTGPGALFYNTADSIVYQYTGSQWRPLHGSDTGRIQIAYVRNTTGSTMTTGQVVYINGSTGNVPTVALAYNKQDSTSAMTFGFVRGDIAHNGFGWITTFGPVDGINTNAYTEGEVIYLDSVAGQFTHDKPQAPYHMVTLGYIVKKSGNGIIFTKIQNGYELDELHNVKITGPVLNKSVIIYDSVKSLWVDTTLAASGLVVTDTTVTKKQLWKPKNTYEVFDEFVQTTSIHTSYATGSGALASDLNIAPRDSLDVGVAWSSTGTTATGRAMTYLGFGQSGNHGPITSQNVKTIVMQLNGLTIPTLSDSTGGTEIFRFGYGLFDWIATDPGGYGVQLIYDRAAFGPYWVLRSNNGGAISTVVTTSVVGTSRVNLRIEISNMYKRDGGGSIRAYLNDVEVVASSGTYPIVTNIPAGTATYQRFYPAYIIQKTTGTTARTCFLDGLYFYSDYITNRY